MTDHELEVVRRAIELLQGLVPTDAPGTGRAPTSCPVRRFAEQYLAAEAESDLTTAEAWTFFREVAGSGELPAMRKPLFLRRLPDVLRTVYGVPKCHNLKRNGRSARGFRSITIREQADLPAGPEMKPD